MKKRYPIVVFIFLFCLSLRGDEFFEIKSVKFYKDENPSGAEITKIVEDEEGKRVMVRQAFVEIKVSTRKRTRFDSIFAKVYFYDSNRKYLAVVDAPDVAIRPGKGKYSLPAFLKEKRPKAYFSLRLKK